VLKSAAGPVTGDWSAFRTVLEQDFALSPVKLRAIREIAGEVMSALSARRPDGDVVYWVVASTEPTGKPLEACRLVPVALTLYDPQDIPPPGGRCGCADGPTAPGAVVRQKKGKVLFGVARAKGYFDRAGGAIAGKIFTSSEQSLS